MIKFIFLFSLLALLYSVTPLAQESQGRILLIANQIWESRQTTVQVLNIDTGLIEELFTIDTPYTGFSLSPAGDRLAYYAIPPISQSLPDPGEAITYYIRYLPGDVSMEVITALDPERSSVPKHPVWSMDGTRVAVVNYDQDYNRLITVIDAATGTVIRRLFVDSIPAFDRPLWSPDDSSLAYFAEYCSRCGIGTVYIISTTHDNKPRPIMPMAEPRDIYTDYLIGWLPDSREVIVKRFETYRAQTDHPQVQVLRVHVETGEVAAIPQDQVIEDCYGRFVLLDRPAELPNEVPSDSGYSRCTRVLSPDLNRITLLTKTLTQEPVIRVYDLTTSEPIAQFPAPNEISSIMWTPDGNRLVFRAVSNGIYIANADSSEEPQLITNLELGRVVFIGWISVN